jgi:hypothetical protein
MSNPLPLQSEERKQPVLDLDQIRQRRIGQTLGPRAKLDRQLLEESRSDIRSRQTLQ